MITFHWEDFSNKKVIELREKYQLEKIISGKTEFEKQIALKNWIHSILHEGNPQQDYSRSSALEIISDSQQGKPMWCTQYALAYLQCAVSLGWYCRKISVDYDHQFGEEERHHGIVDVWSNDFKKWFVVDAQNNLHFEKDGIPLNTLEIRNEFIKNGGQDIDGILGEKNKILKYLPEDRGFTTPSNYFWFFISLRNNFMEKPGLFDTQALLWVDRFNQDKIWYVGGGKKGKSHKHSMYKSQFIATSSEETCFPIMS